VIVTMRRWIQLLFNWQAFAERVEIEIPVDARRLWTVWWLRMLPYGGLQLDRPPPPPLHTRLQSICTGPIEGLGSSLEVLVLRDIMFCPRLHKEGYTPSKSNDSYPNLLPIWLSQITPKQHVLLTPLPCLSFHSHGESQYYYPLQTSSIPTAVDSTSLEDTGTSSHGPIHSHVFLVLGRPVRFCHITILHFNTEFKALSEPQWNTRHTDVLNSAPLRKRFEHKLFLFALPTSILVIWTK
jgi:hypothetical protein